jgi:hypothetical protein
MAWSQAGRPRPCVNSSSSWLATMIPSLGVCAVAMALVGATVRDRVPLDREQYLAQPVLLDQAARDFGWIHDERLQEPATISLGGPGVNALAHRWPEEVPVSPAFGERYFIPMDPDLADPRASVWGMDIATTQIAVSVFIDRSLPRFFERCDTTDPYPRHQAACRPRH